ncbi:hypothetical protein HGO38_28895 [Rhizobium sp. CG5]|uniref:endonuclease/exonuclease/phosphatase family protein n=1 Tax=Rhizobium sp. CG5 TaxID=2726076 RepID=UPI002034468B|nr:endonuclease/exonuclease/phosphatase family protein [Rhizobium sp. CG5]MCM2477469.1 hypothetical protein [Rhizobium sp. CG5]
MREKTSCVIGAILSLCLLVICLRYVAYLWPLTFVQSLQIHIGLAVMVGAALCYALSRGPYPVVLMAAALLVALHGLFMQWQVLPDATGPAMAAGRTVRILHFNILGNNRENGDRIAETILASGADIAFIMEAEPLEPFLDRLSAAYPYRIGCGVGTDTCDLLLLSRRPIVKPVVGALSDLRRDRFAMADIDIDGRIVHFAAAHLTKPYFDDYHGGELEILKEIIGYAGGPFVLAGDFNASAIAPDMQDFLDVSGMTTTGWEPATWPIAAGPLGIAIDHIFVSKTLVPVSLQRLKDNLGSNHYGLIAEILIPPAA